MGRCFDREDRISVFALCRSQDICSASTMAQRWRVASTGRNISRECGPDTMVVRDCRR